MIFDEQFRFCVFHLIELQVARLSEYITDRFTWKVSTGVMFLDVNKEFVKVRIYKLIDLKFNMRTVKLKYSFL